MTELTVDREQMEFRLSPALAKVLTILVMTVLLVGTVSLLTWAINNRLDKTEVVKSSQVTAAVRERQLTCLAKNIFHEAASEPFEGKVAVAQVTLNRVASGLFPDDVCRTIYQKNIIYEKVVCQFSWVCDRVIVDKRISNHPNYHESMEVAKKVLLEGFRLPSLHDALYYHADYVNPGWKKEKVAKIGRHIFYR